MVRHWQPEDMVKISQLILELRDLTLLGKDERFDVSQEDLVKWLLTMYTSHRSTCLLLEEEGGIMAVAGITYDNNMFPPHLCMLYEWCLWRDSARSVAKVWTAAKEWGKSRGALYAKRSQVAGHKEYVKWELL